MIAREATGSMRDAESLMDQAIAFAGKKVATEQIKEMLGFLDRKLLFDMLGAVFAKDVKKALSLLDEVFETGADLSRFAMDVLACLRHMLVIKECGFEKNLLDLPGDEAEALNGFSSQKGAEELHQMFALWYASADNIARSSFPKMLLEVLIMRLSRVEPVRPVAELMEEIEALTAGCEKQDTRHKTQDKKADTRHETQDKKADTRHKTQDLDEHKTLDTGRGTNWDGFMKWLSVNRPQIASIFQHGTVASFSGDDLEMAFDSRFYAEMLLEADRKTQVDELLRTFFKRPVRLAVKSGNGGREEAPKAEQPAKQAANQERKKALTKEALETDIVREAADILNAKVHDVRVGEDKEE